MAGIILTISTTYFVIALSSGHAVIGWSIAAAIGAAWFASLCVWSFVSNRRDNRNSYHHAWQSTRRTVSVNRAINGTW